MKLTTLLLIIALVQASAAGYSQVTLKEKNAPLKDVLNAIKKQTGYTFFYDQQDVNNVKVNIQVNNATLKETLDKCLEENQLTYEIKENTVFISKKEPTFLDKLKDNITAAFTNIDVTGRVLDEQGLPIASATVTVKGTSNATITDATGYFNLHNVDDKAIIVISVIGFDKKEIPATKNIGAIKLVVAINKLDELQIIAYGETSQRLSTGNVAAVSSKEIEEQPVSNPLLSLEGRVPGLFITQANGIANGGVTVRIQGTNSVNSGNDPLYIIDGAPYVSQMLITTNLSSPLGGAGSSANQRGGLGNPMSFINPDDIENIEVLKDADATAIYGSRAANGAILITTKKGKAGPAKVDLNFQQGIGQYTRFIPMMNTQEYLQMRREALKNDGILTPAASDYDINGLWDQSRNTDWVKTLIGGKAQYSDYNGTISGGTATTQYIVGGTFHRETTVYPSDYADEKGGLHFSLTTASVNQKLHIQLTANYLLDNNRLPQTDLSATAYTLAPDAPALYNADGTLNWAPNAAGASSWTNPLAVFYNSTYQSKTNNLLSTGNISYNIISGLDIRSTFGYTNLNTNEYDPFPLSAKKPETRATSSRAAQYSYSTINLLSAEPQIHYKKVISKGVLDFIIGSSIQENSSSGQQYTGVTYSNDNALPDIKSASTVTVGSTLANVYKYNALFGKLNYNWQDTYIVDFALRRDGSSRFGPQNEFHNFGSVAGAWIFSKEKLFSNTAFLSFGKIKASYGTTGNDQIGDYQYLDLYGVNNPAVAYQGVGGLAVTKLPNPYLQWELTRKLSVGLDLGFLKDRILFSTSFNKNQSSNELLPYGLPIITGVGSITENFPATIQNTSWEFNLNTINFKNKDFSWSSNFNFTIPQNKLVAFPNLATSSSSNTFVIGQSINIAKAYHFLGVDPATGLYQFADHNGNPTVSPNSTTDRSVLINQDPKYYGGVVNSIHYKNFGLDFLFQFTKKTTLVGNGLFGFGNGPGYFNMNQPAALVNRWQNPGDIATVQRVSTTTSNFSAYNAYSLAIASDANYADASYIRLKNLSFSYELPKKWKEKAHLLSCKVYVQGQDLFTITKFPGGDPESGSYFAPLNVLTFGIKMGL